MLSVPGSPVSRRSSSISTVGQFGRSTVLYSRVTPRKKQPAWRIASHPLPKNVTYRRSLLCALISSVLAAAIFLTATLTFQWETITYNFDNIFRALGFHFGQPLPFAEHDVTQVSLNIESNLTTYYFNVEYIVFENGHLAHPSDIDVLKAKLPAQPYTIKEISGIFVRLVGPEITRITHSISTEVVSADWRRQLGRKRIARPVMSDVESTEFTQPMRKEVAWIVLNYRADIWNMYYKQQ
ncbi:unnamed protein product, partial [Dicrocoelium dendriticum]